MIPHHGVECGQGCRACVTPGAQLPPGPGVRVGGSGATGSSGSGRRPAAPASRGEGQPRVGLDLPIVEALEPGRPAPREVLPLRCGYGTRPDGPEPTSRLGLCSWGLRQRGTRQPPPSTARHKVWS
jgi:hypothetical protein